MTSKNLSFKLMAEDLKRRVWAIALTVLALIFAQIFPIAVKCSEYAEQAGKWNQRIHGGEYSVLAEGKSHGCGSSDRGGCFVGSDQLLLSA